MNLVDQIRSRLTHDQREMLSAIWGSYRAEGKWLLRRVLHHRFLNRLAANEVRAALEQLGGRVVYDLRDNQRDCYALTFLGMLVTDEGPQLEQLCLGYLEFVRNLYIDNPEVEQVSGPQIQAALQLSTEQSQLLGSLVSFGHLYGSFMSAAGSPSWSAGIPEDVDSMPGHPHLQSYLRRKALQDYEQTVPIDENGRAGYYQRRTSLNFSPWADLGSDPFAAANVDGTDSPDRDRLYIDDIDSFEKVKGVTREMVDRFLQDGFLSWAEDQVQLAMEAILDVPFHKKDWGGEVNDVSTANVVVDGRRRDAAFLLKGPGIGRKEMTIADCGKHGDQIMRLVSMAHDLFFIQSIGPIADAVVHDLQIKVRDLNTRGRNAQYVIIDGQDTARLLYAYGKLR